MDSTLQTVWANTTIGNAIDIFDFKRIPISGSERKQRQGQYPYYGASGIIDYIDDYIFNGQYLLIAEDGENLNSRKVPVAFFAKGKFWVNNHAHIVRAKAGIADDHFLFSWFAQENISGYITGAAQPKLSQANLKRIELRLPPLPTQRKIAAILSAYDNLIDNNLRRIKILEEMAQNLYREWFVKFRFPGHQHARFTDSPLGRIPEEWEVKRILEFGNVITGKTPSKANPDFYGEDVPFVKTPDMHGNTFILDVGERLSVAGAQSQANKTIPAGSICVSCIGTIGVVSITTEDCQTNQQINSVVLMKEQFREFLFLRLKDAKQALENLGANGATMGNVNKGKFESLEVITPSDDLVYRYHECTAPLFSEMLVLSRKNTTLRRTRDLLLPRLISGEVDVSELNIAVPEEAVA